MVAQNVTMTQLVNVPDLSVDVGDNTSVLDTLNLTFVYDNISGTKKKSSKTPRDNRVSIGVTERTDLRWIVTHICCSDVTPDQLITSIPDHRCAPLIQESEFILM